MHDCLLCREDGGELLWQDAGHRIVWAGQPEQPGLCRVIAQRHVKEMSDLDPAQRQRTMAVVFALEEALRELLAPDKINLASLGNVVPHLHWHVIPRFAGDAHFPNAIWGERLRDAPPPPLPPDFPQRMRHALQGHLAG
ncbi:MAG: HIT family protein [Burkholderiales bacterium]|nr:HIT family protein [Burkholderiales bacterium]